MAEIDKTQHYGRYQHGEDQRRRLALKVAHKALDIPEEDMVRVDKRGVGALALIGVALAAGLPAALLGFAMLRSSPPAPPVQGWDAVTEELQPDGTWKQISRERLKE